MTAPTLPTRNPRTGEIDYAMPVVTPAQVQSTAARLRAAQTAWVAAGVDHRVAVMQRWAAALAAERDALVAALVADTGRHAEAVLEFDATLGALQRWCAQAPALLTEEPAARLRFRSLAAVPELAAVLAYVTGGPATGEALVRAVDAVCFTGSVKTGRRVGLAAMEAFIPSFLELGGKDAALVLADADLHRTARSLAWGGMVGAGQSCMSIECVYVDATVAQPFTDLLVQREAALRHNWPDRHSPGPDRPHHRRGPG